MEAFRKLELKDPVLKSLEEHGFKLPTEIQEKTIPLVLQGKDIIAGAATGSGKTLAFGSGIMHNCKKDYGIQALVLCPTRELAEQISKALSRFSKYNPLKITPIYGGVSITPQIRELESSEVVIGTPGRILDHIARNSIDLSHLKILVLDEADRMLDMGFRDDVEKIIDNCPLKRQTLLFSATISEEISRLAKKYMNSAIEISAEQYVDPSKMYQSYYDIDDKRKFSLLVHLLKNEQAKLVMVFCNTRKNVDFVANNLNANGIEALPIHGGFSQDKRNKIMEHFNSNKIKVLVCTDIAARGLDIKGVSHVYNYDIPQESKEYIHRIGRTARAGTEGKVINIVASRDYDNFQEIIKDDSINIILEKSPDFEWARIQWTPQQRGRGRFSRGGFSGNRKTNNFRERRESSYRGRDNNHRPRSRYGRSNSQRDSGQPNRSTRSRGFGNRNRRY